jgi:hypothetical protein
LAGVSYRADVRTALGTRIRRWLAFPLGFETAIAGIRRKGRAVTTMHPEPSSLKRMFADYMWEWLTPSFIFALYYAPASIIIIMLAPFQVGSEFVTGFCLGGAITSGCVIISDLHRGYREFKRQSDESDRLNHQWNKT